MTADPRDLKTTFGGVTLHDGFPTFFLTKSETEMRRSLASIAHAYGWDVREEVVIPRWGRIDIVLEAGATYLIELKMDLTKPAKIRRAFQQADGYGRWWANNHGRSVSTLLVGAEMDQSAIDVVADTYYAVWARSIPSIIYFFEHGSHNTDNALRRERAAARSLAVAELGAFYSQAGARMREAQEKELASDGVA